MTATGALRLDHGLAATGSAADRLVLAAPPAGTIRAARCWTHLLHATTMAAGTPLTTATMWTAVGRGRHLRMEPPQSMAWPTLADSSQPQPTGWPQHVVWPQSKEGGNPSAADHGVAHGLAAAQGVAAAEWLVVAHGVAAAHELAATHCVAAAHAFAPAHWVAVRRVATQRMGWR